MTEQMPIDLATMEASFKKAAAMAVGRLDLDEVAALHCLLRGHLAVLLDDARELAKAMPVGGFDRHRMDIHLQRLTALHDRAMAPSAGAAYSDVRQLVRGCEWLLTQLDVREPA